MKPETMSGKTAAEDRAEKRYPMDHYTHQVQREAYIACIREEVEPLEAENVKLRALVQGLVDALEGTKSNTGWWRSHPSEEWIADAIADAASQGFTPTNTKDNG